MKEKIKFLILVWTIGFLGGLFFWFLRLIKLIDVLGYEKRKLSPCPSGLICFYRHPSLREPVVLPFLFFPRFLFDLRFLPFVTPDENYYRQFWFLPLWPISISINREGKVREVIRALKKIKKGLDEGKIFFLAPGGGREWREKEFKIIKDGKIEIREVSGQKSFWDLEKEVNGKIIRRFRAGIAWLVKNTETKILPIWVKKRGLKIKIIIGELEKPSKLGREEMLEYLENILLKLGDKS